MCVCLMCWKPGGGDSHTKKDGGGSTYLFWVKKADLLVLLVFNLKRSTGYSSPPRLVSVSSCVAIELVPLRGGKKKIKATPTKQGFGTPRGSSFSKFLTSTPVHFICESFPPRAGNLAEG